MSSLDIFVPRSELTSPPQPNKLAIFANLHVLDPAPRSRPCLAWSRLSSPRHQGPRVPSSMSWAPNSRAPAPSRAWQGGVEGRQGGVREWNGMCARAHLHANTLRHIQQNKTSMEALGRMTSGACAAARSTTPRIAEGSSIAANVATRAVMASVGASLVVW